MLSAIATLVWGRKPSCPSWSEGGAPGLCASHHHTSRDSVCEGHADWPHCGSRGKIKPLHAAPPGRVRPPPATRPPLIGQDERTETIEPLMEDVRGHET